MKTQRLRLSIKNALTYIQNGTIYSCSTEALNSLEYSHITYVDNTANPVISNRKINTPYVKINDIPAARRKE